MPELLVPGSAQVLHWCSILCYSTPLRFRVFPLVMRHQKMVSDSEPVPLLCPSNVTQPLLFLLRNEILTATTSQTKGVPCHHYYSDSQMDATEKRGTMFFLVWVTYDRDTSGVEDPFFRSLQRIMGAAKCPAFRYKTESRH